MIAVCDHVPECVPHWVCAGWDESMRAAPPPGGGNRPLLHRGAEQSGGQRGWTRGRLPAPRAGAVHRGPAPPRPAPPPPPRSPSPSRSGPWTATPARAPSLPTRAHRLPVPISRSSHSRRADHPGAPGPAGGRTRLRAVPGRLGAPPRACALGALESREGAPRGRARAGRRRPGPGAARPPAAQPGATRVHGRRRHRNPGSSRSANCLGEEISRFPLGRTSGLCPLRPAPGPLSRCCPRSGEWPPWAGRLPESSRQHPPTLWSG